MPKNPPLDHFKIAKILGSEIAGTTSGTPKVSDLPAPLWKAICNYRDAAIADSWKGGGDPDDVPTIERDLRNARMNLLITLAEYLK